MAQDQFHRGVAGRPYIDPNIVLARLINEAAPKPRSTTHTVIDKQQNPIVSGYLREDGSAHLELHGVTADRRASLVTGLVRMLDILIETEKGFTVKPFAKSQRIAA
jgi:hypothetical protein